MNAEMRRSKSGGEGLYRSPCSGGLYDRWGRGEARRRSARLGFALALFFECLNRGARSRGGSAGLRVPSRLSPVTSLRAGPGGRRRRSERRDTLSTDLIVPGFYQSRCRVGPGTRLALRVWKELIDSGGWVDRSRLPDFAINGDRFFYLLLHWSSHYCRANRNLIDFHRDRVSVWKETVFLVAGVCEKERVCLRHTKNKNQRRSILNSPVFLPRICSNK